MSAFLRTESPRLRFRSKIDLWLGGVILLGAGLSGTVALGLLFQEGLAALAIIPLLATGLSIWVLFGTWYDVSDTTLFVRCGPFRTAVLLSTVRAIRPTRTVLSAPALSLDRLQLTHAGGVLVISPADATGFVRALRERGAAVAVIPGEDAAFAGGQERLLKWVMPLVPVVVLSVVGATVISGSNPLQVDITADAVTVRGSWGASVPTGDITSVTLVETLPHLRRTMGYGGWGTMRGRAASRDLGPYGHAYVTRGAPPFVVARTATHGFLVFNTDDPAQTRRLFEQLRSTVAAVETPR